MNNDQRGTSTALNLYDIGQSNEDLQSALQDLRADFDSHIHDGTNSRVFQTASADTFSGRVFTVRKSAQNDYTDGMWMGLVGDTFQFNMGGTSQYVLWDGSALTITGTITGSTIIGGTFETATSGKRMTLTGSDNTFRFYDSTGQVIGIGTDGSGFGFRFDLTSVTNNGILVNSAVAGNGFYYTNTGNVANRGIYVEQTNTGANNNLPALQILYNGVGITAYMKVTNGATGLYVDNSGASASGVFNATNSGSYDAVQINNSGNGNAINITTVTSGGNPIGIKMNISNSSGNSYAFGFNGSEFASSGFAGSIFRKVRVLFPSGTVGYIYCYNG